MEQAPWAVEQEVDAAWALAVAGDAWADSVWALRGSAYVRNVARRPLMVGANRATQRVVRSAVHA